MSQINYPLKDTLFSAFDDQWRRLVHKGYLNLKRRYIQDKTDLISNTILPGRIA